MWYLKLSRVPEYYAPAPKGQPGAAGPLFTAYTDEGYTYEFQPGVPVPPEIPSIQQITMDAEIEGPEAYKIYN